MLLDSSVARVEQRIEADFDAAVAAVRLGTVIAHDRKAATRWDRSVAKRHKTSLGAAGAALENAVASLAATHPEYVVTG